MTGRFPDTPLRVFQEQLSVNFLGAVSMTQGASPLTCLIHAEPLHRHTDIHNGKLPVLAFPASAAWPPCVVVRWYGCLSAFMVRSL